MIGQVQISHFDVVIRSQICAFNCHRGRTKCLISLKAYSPRDTEIRDTSFLDREFSNFKINILYILTGV